MTLSLSSVFTYGAADGWSTAVKVAVQPEPLTPPNSFSTS